MRAWREEQELLNLNKTMTPHRQHDSWRALGVCVCGGVRGGGGGLTYSIPHLPRVPNREGSLLLPKYSGLSGGFACSEFIPFPK